MLLVLEVGPNSGLITSDLLFLSSKKVDFVSTGYTYSHCQGDERPYVSLAFDLGDLSLFQVMLLVLYLVIYLREK